jgi:hypothetical protein
MKSIKDKYLDINSKEINLNLNEHLDANGEFDYDAYVEAQTKVNLKKIDFSGPNYSRISMVAAYIKKHIPNIKFGICHGTRRGTEQRDFKNILNIPVIGTEISHTAEQFPDTIQWDFHEVKEEWLDNASFIFSNSLDHSYDPIKCLNAWMSCIVPNGKIFLQRGQDDLPEIAKTNKYPEADMFQASEKAFAQIVDAAGNGEWTVLYPEELKINNEKRIIVLERKK